MRFLLSLLFILAYNFPIWTQPFNFRNYSVGEGVAQSQVFAVLADSRGFIWLGTQGGGLSRFDGRVFKTFTQQDGLSGNVVNALLEDKDGLLWIGTDRGLTVYDGLKMEKWGTIEVGVKSLKQAASGRIWVGSTAGLYYVTTTSLKRMSAPARSVNTVFIDKADRVWVGTQQGLWEVVNGVAKQRNTEPFEVTALAEGPEGMLYVGILGGKMQVWDGAKLTPFVGNDQLNSSLITSLMSAKDQQIWIGTQNDGLFLWDVAVKTMTHLSVAEGLADKNIQQMTTDAWGNTWIGTSGGGVSWYGGQQFDHFAEKDGLAGDAVYAFSQDTAGRLYFSVDDRGVMVKTDTSMVHISPQEGLKEVKVKAMLHDSRTNWWLGTEGMGLCMAFQDTFYYLSQNEGLSGKFVRSLAEDQKGYIWIGTGDGGLNRLELSIDSLPYFQIRHWNTRDGLPSNQINQVHIDKKGRIWMAFVDAGLACWSEGNVLHHFTTANGLPANHIRSIVEDSSGYLWVGSSNNGIARLNIYEDSLSFLSVTREDGLFSNNVYLLLIDKSQQLWVGSQAGVDRIGLDAERQLKSIQHYGKSEGFLGIETCRNAAWEDTFGDLWFGTVEGLTRYKPGFLQQGDIPPRIILTDIKLFYKSLQETPYESHLQAWNQLDSTLVLPYDENHLGFSFLGLDQAQPAKVRYRYWLEGWEPDWSLETENREQTYANLPPGLYTFWVKAVHVDTKLESAPIHLSFYIQPPWWENRWLKTGGVMLGGFLVLWIFSSQLRKVRRKAKRAQEQLHIEKHIVELEQKALQLQMNPHFIFNALNSIQLLIGKNNEQTARAYLAKFSRLMRSTLENARQNRLCLADEMESLERYLALEQFSRGNTFQYSILVEPEAEAEEVFIPPMMVQPFVENAIIHGVGPLKEKGVIKVHFYIREKEVLCTIEDNGVGFKQGEARRSASHQSTALQVTKERLALLNGSARAEEEMFEIGPPSPGSPGTLVKIHLPLL